MMTSYRKQLTANDIGKTGAHQAGICVPRNDEALLSFFPILNPATFNPDAWLFCEAESGKVWRMRYVYYNGKIHRRNTRNEYRITHTTKLFRQWEAKEGDTVVFTATSQPFHYKIRIERLNFSEATQREESPGLIVLRGWSRVY